MANTVHSPPLAGAITATLDDQARRLVAERRFQDAAEILLADVRASGTALARLDSLRRQRALRASICLANAGDYAQAETLLIDLGEVERATALRARMQPPNAREASPAAGSPFAACDARSPRGATLPLVASSQTQTCPDRTEAIPELPAGPSLGEPSGTVARRTESLSTTAQPGVSAGSGPEPGCVIDGRFRIDRSIGEGGAARVFRATDLVLNEQIAIKFLVQEPGNETMLARFRAEVTLSRRLNHPNVIRLYDIGAFQGWHFITMELLSGADLASVLAGGALRIERAINLLLQACAGLQAVHDRGIIHRDIKPANFFVTADGLLKVMDFGISKRRDVAGLTSGGPGAGTPLYMSPEQFSDFSRVTPQADLYSLGCIAYEMFTGRPPFQHAEVLPLMVMHINDRPSSPKMLNPHLPQALETIILQLLEKDPRKRIESCRELAERLCEFQRNL
jgi:serine/threonine-protein kinase